MYKYHSFILKNTVKNVKAYLKNYLARALTFYELLLNVKFKCQML